MTVDNSEWVDKSLFNNSSDILSTHDEVISLLKKEFSRIDTSSATRLAKIIFDREYSNISVTDFKKNYKGFLRRNLGKFDEKNIEISNDKYETKYFLKENCLTDLSDKLIECAKSIGASIKHIEEDDEYKWNTTDFEGEEVFQVTTPTTFQDVREKACKEGKNVCFKFDFSKVSEKASFYKNISTTQVLDIYINDAGVMTDYPLNYIYKCPICGSISKRHEYEVSSTHNNHKCTQLIPAEPKSKKCNTLLSPDSERTETKTAFIYKISFKDENGIECRADALSFINLPTGILKAAIQKIPNSFAMLLLHIVDYKNIKREKMPLPDKNIKEHYIFTLIKSIDNYILKKTNYKHYGYLPMKIAMILQMAARYNKGFENNFHIALIGDKSTGKSQFAKYWGLTLYSQNSVSAMATSLSIPKLRGTMETFSLFGKERRFQTKGIFGEKDLIIIDELKENSEVKNDIKQFALDSIYAYLKAGGNGVEYIRSAQLITTENVDIIHHDRYIFEIKKLYQSDNIQLVNLDNEPKPSWDSKIDLDLELSKYDNPYLRYAIKKVRNEYLRKGVNWIDGSEIALKQRYVFYFFLSSEKMSEEFNKVLKENATKNIITNNIDIKKMMDSTKYIEFFESLYKYNAGKNDIDYFYKIDKMIKDYEKAIDSRTILMWYDILRLIRIIDGRDYCTNDDLKILQYLLESVDNKIQISETSKYKIYGHIKDDTDDKVNEKTDSEKWEYNDNMDVFK